ncbi:hypothetical protein FQN57_007545 [Myotisia sp. PD_48]|nr:hypothetical protein FQN57_007545 [Myotisia sp. PD_48]
MSNPILFSACCRWHASSRLSTYIQLRTITSISSSIRQNIPNIARSPPIFLLPFRYQERHAQLSRPLLQCRSSPPSKSSRYRSPFSTSTARRATIVTQNPQVNEEGEALVVSISPRAAKRLRQITEPEPTSSTPFKGTPYDHLRITVTSGGCHGFQYLMSLEPVDKIDSEEDTVFEVPPEQTPESENAVGQGQAKVVMDSASLELLSGSTVDYTTELIGSQFKIVDNPRATSSCGCGTSFDVIE